MVYGFQIEIGREVDKWPSQQMESLRCEACKASRIILPRHTMLLTRPPRATSFAAQSPNLSVRGDKGSSQSSAT